MPADPKFTSRSVNYYRVDAIDAEVARLADLGVEFHDKPQLVHREGAHELWLAWLIDPDGHHVVLLAERAG